MDTKRREWRPRRSGLSTVMWISIKQNRPAAKIMAKEASNWWGRKAWSSRQDIIMSTVHTKSFPQKNFDCAKFQYQLTDFGCNSQVQAYLVCLRLYLGQSVGGRHKSGLQSLSKTHLLLGSNVYKTLFWALVLKSYFSLACVFKMYHMDKCLEGKVCCVQQLTIFWKLCTCLRGNKLIPA